MLEWKEFDRVRGWMLRNARPIDLARWKYHFEEGSIHDVMTCLGTYQNSDGGFGNALEADSWNPFSTPVQTAAAIGILKESGFQDRRDGLVKAILEYLEGSSGLTSGRWRNVVESNDDYPHAPWWSYDSGSAERERFNPTATLTGFILVFSDRNSDLFNKALAIADDLLGEFLTNPKIDMHPLMCIQDLLEDISRARVESRLRHAEAVKALNERSVELISSDKDNWGGYCTYPSNFVKSRGDEVDREIGDLSLEEADWLINKRNEDGVWDISWKWDNYPKEFAISENWWKGSLCVRNCLFLRAMGQIEGMRIRERI
jgi:hypothetical protein